MNTKLGSLGHRAPETIINNSCWIKVIWYTERENGEQSPVRAAQRLSDKSFTSLGASAYEMHPLHFTLLSFKEERRRYHVQHGYTIIAYLPVGTCIVSQGCHGEDSEEPFSEKIIVSRVLLLKNHHFRIDDILQPLADEAFVGSLVQARDQKRLRMRIVMGYHVCGNPESEDILAVSSGNQTKCSCHGSLLIKFPLNKSKILNSCALRTTLRMLQPLSRSDDTGGELLNESSM